MQISKEALQPLTHIRQELAKGRVIPLIPVWDGSGWKQWLPGPRGDLVLARVRDVAWGEYLATKPAGTTDLWFPFLEFMLQRASWPNVSRAVAAIIDDMAGLAISLSKCDFYWQQRVGLEPLLAGEYVRTEVEYVLVVARSLLDHLQEVLSALWNTVRL